MEERKIIPTWVTVVFMLLVVGSLIINFLSFSQDALYGTIYVVQRIIGCWAFLLALIYGLTGYAKSSAVLFKVFCAMDALSVFIYLFIMLQSFSQSTSDYLAFGAMLICFAIISIFTFAKDLGKKVSYILVAIMFATYIIDALTQPTVNVTYVLASYSRIVLIVVFFIMVFAKYKDKAQRGSK